MALSSRLGVIAAIVNQSSCDHSAETPLPDQHAPPLPGNVQAVNICWDGRAHAPVSNSNWFSVL